MVTKIFASFSFIQLDASFAIDSKLEIGTKGSFFTSAIAFKNEAVILRAVYEPGPQANAIPLSTSKPSLESNPILSKSLSQSGRSFRS